MCLRYAGLKSHTDAQGGTAIHHFKYTGDKVRKRLQSKTAYDSTKRYNSQRQQRLTLYRNAFAVKDIFRSIDRILNGILKIMVENKTAGRLVLIFCIKR